MVSETPVVTVAMPIYNAGGYLRAAVNSIVFQTFTDWELLIIDDGSTDNATDTLADLHDPRIRILRDGHNRGLAARLNQAIELARGEFFARMDQDDVSWPERLERQVERLRSEPSLDLVATRAIRIDERSDSIGLFPAPKSDADISTRPWQGFYMPHPAWTGRLRWFRAHRYATPGPYFCEDQELLLRSYTSSRFAILNDVLFAYRVRQRFNPAKQFKTRVAVWRVQRAQFRQRRQWGYMLLAGLTFSARAAADVLRRMGWILTGDAERKPSRLAPVLEARWLQVRQLVTKASSA